MCDTGDGLRREWVVLAAGKWTPGGAGVIPEGTGVILGRLWEMGLVGGASNAWTITDIAAAQL